MEFDKEKNCYYFYCPHQECQMLIEVKKEDINCKIFRHGIYKKNYKMLDPHLKKSECDRLKENDLIYGCGKPFKFDGVKVEICDYI